MKRTTLFSLMLALLWFTPATTPAAPKARLTPSERECKELATSICFSLSAKKPDEFFRALDADAIIDRALEGVPGGDTLKEADRKVIKTGFTSSLKEPLKAMDYYEFVRFRGDTGEAQVLIRLIADSGDFNFWYLTIAYTGTSNPRIVDIYPFTSGENISVTLRRTLVPMLAEQNKSLFAKLTGQQSDFIKYSKEWTAFFALNAQQKYAEALAAYAKLPASLQNEKLVQIARITATVNTSPKDLPARVAEFRKMFPGDASLAYYSYAAHLAARAFADTLGDIDEMEKEFGKNTFFDFLRARTYALMSNGEQALTFARQALNNPRRLSYAEDFCLNLLVEQKQYDDAARLLREMERDTDTEMYSLIRKNRSYAAFFRSDAFRKWMESTVKRPVDPAIKPVFQNAATTPARPTGTATPAPAATKAAPTPQPPKEPEPPYKLGGILYSKTSPAAIINRKTVYVGDRVNEAKVVKIEQTSVTLEIDGKTEVLHLK